MKKYLSIISGLCLFKLFIHWFGNQNYGFHRDELLHLAASEHLDWGFLEFPPFIAFIGKLSYWMFGYSLMGVRLFPTLAGIGILILCCLIAKELGGKRWAVLLTGLCVLAFVSFYRNHTLFQPVAFNQFFWTLGFFVLIKYLKTNQLSWLIFLGVVGGLGLMNKYLMLVWGLGIAIGLLFYNRGQPYKSWRLYGAGLIALLIFLPNILWQYQHGWPELLHLAELQSKQLNGQNPFSFGLYQLDSLFTFGVAATGAFALFKDNRLNQYRSLGIAVVVIFITLWLLQAKAYYFFGAYPMLFAAGAVKIEKWLKRTNPGWNYTVAGLILLPSLYFIPEATPILPIEQYVKYQGLEKKNNRVELTSDYADMFGWKEQVQWVDSVYKSLPPNIRKQTVLWAENYGEAGALQILGDKYDLPDPISRHGSFWLWGYGNPNAQVWISIGNEKESVEHVFEDVELVKTIYHKYAIGEENGIPLYICRKPKVNIAKWWAGYEEHVFD